MNKDLVVILLGGAFWLPFSALCSQDLQASSAAWRSRVRGGARVVATAARASAATESCSGFSVVVASGTAAASTVVSAGPGAGVVASTASTPAPGSAVTSALDTSNNVAHVHHIANT